MAVCAESHGAEKASQGASSGSATPLSVEELTSTGKIYFAGVRAPLGAFVLARHGRMRCAVRIDRFWDEGDANDINGAGYKQFASYTSFYRADSNGNLAAEGHHTKSGGLSRLPPIGPGRLAFQPGNRKVDCGKLTLYWNYPNWIEFRHMKGLELAITQISDPEKVRFDAPELRWASEDLTTTRPPEVLMRSALCCSSAQ